VVRRQETPNLKDPSLRVVGAMPVLRATQGPMACVRWVGHGTCRLQCEGVARAQAGGVALVETAAWLAPGRW
jgi:hypothetical protein